MGHTEAETERRGRDTKGHRAGCHLPTMCQLCSVFSFQDPGSPEQRFRAKIPESAGVGSNPSSTPPPLHDPG